MRLLARVVVISLTAVGLHKLFTTYQSNKSSETGSTSAFPTSNVTRV